MNSPTTSTESHPSGLWNPILDRRTLAMISFALAVLVIALYLPALRNGFVNYDDPDYVTHNANVLQGLNWENVKWAFGTNNPAANWHPLTWLSHMLDVQIFGLAPWGHHLINVLFMAADIVLLFLFLAAATGKLWQSAAVAVLYAVHPLNVEPVAWVAERKQELSLFFMFLTLIAYVWYGKGPSASRYVTVALLFALALMSKVMIITLPFALLLLDYWPLHRFPSTTFLSLVKEKILLFLLSAAAGWITVGIHKKEGALTASMPLAWRLKNAIYSYAVYLWKAIWPTKLAVFYPHPENRLPMWQITLAAIVLLAITALVWKHRDKKYLTVGWLWYLGTAFPMIGVIQSGRQGMADRYEDLPLIGIFIALVWLAADALSKFQLSPATLGPGFAVMLLPLIILSYRQIAFWKDSVTLFSHTVQVTVHNGIAENNLGAAYIELGDPVSAFPHFVAAVQAAPDLGSAHYNLGFLLQQQGQLQQAADQYKLAIAHAGDAVEASQSHNNLGVIYLTLNNLPLAKAEFDKAIALNPNEVNSYIARGTMEFQQGKMDNALADFTQASSRTRSPIAFYWLGRAEEVKGDFARAKGAYQAALQLNPGMQDARARLGSLQALTGQ
ncbi:MAG TPA: tetratricopeptide repeat protein [Candidatus Acidoferrum sp.]|nr:tetratricopeptide repeat protein [Candidatus Acidoferrum sp.]